MRRLLDAGISAALGVALLLLWELSTRWWQLSALVLPAPSQVARALWQGFATGYWWPHLGQTLLSVGLGLTLVAALGAADLVGAVDSCDDGPVTVFAPTDDAFAKLPAGTVADLLKPENLETLKSILLYHVVPGQVMAADVVTLDGQMVDTASTGNTITISVKDGNVFLNDTVQVIITDVEASNAAANMT